MNLIWKLRVGYHNVVADFYRLLVLRDANKTKHPKIYEYAAKRWKYHMMMTGQIVKDRLDQHLKDKDA